MATTHTTRIVTNETLAEVIKPAHVRKLMRFSQRTGYPVSSIIDRAVDLFMNLEAPVYLANAKQA